MGDINHDLRRLVSDVADDAVELRRAIHRRPELGNAEHETTALVVDFLRRAGLDPVVRTVGVGAHVDVGAGDPIVAFRADLDALPVFEESEVDFASQTPGIMHACGHDAHTAIAAGLARAMASLDLPGRIRFLFQPAEETVPGGAVELVAEGHLEEVEAILAFHVDPSLPPGSVGLMPGPITGASDRVRIEVTGPGGHTSRPHQTTDLVHAAARVVTDLPHLVQRSIDPRSPVAIVFGRIAGGTAENVIPTSVEVAGTVRMFDLELWRTMPTTISRLVDDIVAPLGATAKVDYERGAPPVVNDERVISIVRNAAVEVLGEEGVAPTQQSLGAEDFAWYLEHVPGALVRLGVRPEHGASDLHSADFTLDERAIPIGMLVAAQALMRLLQSSA